MSHKEQLAPVLAADFREVVGFYHHVLPELADWLNNFHGIDRSQEFWNVLLGPALLNFFSIVKGYGAPYDLARDVCPSSATPFPPPFDARQVYAKLIAGELDPLLGKGVEARIDLASVFVVPGPGGGLDGLFFALNRNLFCADFFIPAALARKLRLRFGSFPFLRLPPSPGVTVCPDAAARGRLVDALLPSARNEFEVEATRKLYWAFPVNLLEHFAALYGWSDRASRRFRCVVVSNQYLSDSRVLFIMAWMRERGGLLLGRPHGSTYGMIPDFMFEYCERMISDYYLTWGWVDTVPGSRAKCVPLPEPRLSVFYNTYREAGGPVLWVANTFYRQVLLLSPGFPLPCEMAAWYKSKADFLDAVPQSLQEALFYRPHPSYLVYDWDREEKEFEARFPADRVVKGRDLREQMKSSRMVLLDHPGTALQEAMALNTPCVCFWEPELFAFRSGFAQVMDTLASVGIFQPSPARLATHLRSIEGRASEWWNAAETQQARHVFMESFARSSQHSTYTWLNLFDLFRQYLAGRMSREELDQHLASLR